MFDPTRTLPYGDEIGHARGSGNSDHGITTLVPAVALHFLRMCMLCSSQMRGLELMAWLLNVATPWHPMTPPDLIHRRIRAGRVTFRFKSGRHTVTLQQLRGRLQVVEVSVRKHE